MPKSEIFNIDCLEYMKTLPDKAFSLAVVDPPFGGGNDDKVDKGKRFGARFNKYKKVDLDWDAAPPKEYFDELFRVSENQIIFGANYFPCMPSTRCFLVWRKQTISESFSMAMAEYAWTSFKGNAKVFEYPPQRDKDDINFHATAKPIALYQWIFKNYTKPGDTILDTHLGSGSSRIAAWYAGLDFTGCELNEYYYKKQEERFQLHINHIKQVGDGKIAAQTLF